MVKFRLMLIVPLILLFYGISTAQDPGWYKVYNGTIDKYPITMHLYKRGHQYSGYYYYDSQQKPIDFAGDDTSLPGHNIILHAYLSGKDQIESFVFARSGRTATGQWHNSNNKVLPFAATETDLPVPFDYIYTEGEISLRPNLKDSPQASFEAASVWPKDSSARSIFLKNLIREEFGVKNSTADIGKLLLDQKKEFFSGYRDQYKDESNETVKNSFAFNQEQTLDVTIAYISPKLLSLANSYYEYTGGAHGNYGTSYTCVDLINLRKLAVEDIIKPEGRAQLAAILERSFRKQYDLKNTDSLTEAGLFDNSIEPNQNFCLTSKGIKFCYNPYEIASYAVGTIEVFIPFTELAPYLRPEFKKLMDL